MANFQISEGFLYNQLIFKQKQILSSQSTFIKQRTFIEGLLAKDSLKSAAHIQEVITQCQSIINLLFDSTTEENTEDSKSPPISHIHSH